MKRFYQRCIKCGERAFEFSKNPAKGVTIHIPDDVIYSDGIKRNNATCQNCNVEISSADFGGDRLIAKEPQGYPKYKGQTPIHWTWYLGSSNFGYKELVDNSIRHLKGCTGTILDIGFGDGLVASLLVPQGLEVFGVEPERDGIDAAKRMGVEIKNIYHGTIEDFVAKKNRKFDYVFSLDTIEHVQDASAFVKVMDWVNNFAIIVTDNAISKDGTRRKVNHLHTKEFSYSELQGLFKDFKTEQVDVGNGSFIGIKVYAK